MTTTDTDLPGVVPQWTIGDRIAKARKHADMSADVLAAHLSVSRGTVSNWETGVSPTRPLFLREIARVTGVDYAWLSRRHPSSGGEA